MTKQDLVIEQDSNQVPHHFNGSNESTDNDTTHTLYNRNL